MEATAKDSNSLMCLGIVFNTYGCEALFREHAIQNIFIRNGHFYTHSRANVVEGCLYVIPGCMIGVGYLVHVPAPSAQLPTPPLVGCSDLPAALESGSGETEYRHLLMVINGTE